MILSDFDLKNYISAKRLVITPFKELSIRENGVDFHLDNEYARHVQHDESFVLDPSDETHIKKSYVVTKDAKEIIIGPKEQMLMSTYEYMKMPDDLMGFVEIRSSWARHGLSMPPTIIDAGFEGNVTLEVINNSPYKIKLRPMQRFAHIIFSKTSSTVSATYSGAYNGQRGVKLPKVIKNEADASDKES
ncbi:MAG: dCTP deaminase [Candidatus Marsarchaeota archaeon]|nr:dCTP deaminase [Candidatus Marsarchaeota archaeon]